MHPHCLQKFLENKKIKYTTLMSNSQQLPCGKINMINESCNEQLCTLLANYLYTVQIYIKASKVAETAFMLDAT